MEVLDIIILLIIGILGTAVGTLLVERYSSLDKLNNHKKSAHTLKIDSSQSAINSSGIIQQSASEINIDNQIVIQDTDNKSEKIKRPKNRASTNRVASAIGERNA